MYVGGHILFNITLRHRVGRPDCCYHTLQQDRGEDALYSWKEEYYEVIRSLWIRFLSWEKVMGNIPLWCWYKGERADRGQSSTENSTGHQGFHPIGLENKMNLNQSPIRIMMEWMCSYGHQASPIFQPICQFVECQMTFLNIYNAILNLDTQF